MHKHEPNDWKKYIIVLFITSAIFISGLWLSNYFNNKKVDQLKSIENTISLDLMSSETQFDLLEELSCKDISTTVLSSELNSLAEKIAYSESNIGVENIDVISLKKSYSLLEIKDYLLMKRITERCGQKSIFILYFYKNDNCDDCTKQGYILTSLREKYPNLRVYSFDYNLDISAIRAMISIYKVPDNLPAIVINGKVYSGLKTIEEIEKTFPELESIKVPEPVSKTTTKKTITTSTDAVKQ
jgi:glutaredoxin